MTQAAVGGEGQIVSALAVYNHLAEDATREEADAIAHKPADALAFATAYLKAHGV